MARERYFDERDFEDGAVPGQEYWSGWNYDEEDDLPDLSIPPRKVKSLEEELRRLASWPPCEHTLWRGD